MGMSEPATSSGEFGIFSDEGQLEGSFFSRTDAELALVARYSPEDDNAYVAECYPDRPEEEREGCRECPTEDADDEAPDMEEI